MPNTLAHIGIQGIATRGIFKDADYKWIFIGCIIPDIPWISKKIIGGLFNINPYDLRLYVIIQASFIFCLILSLSLSTLSKSFLKTFAILSLNSLIHLLLDALQIKWGNGVHLFAPFSWQMTNLGLFWPESIPNILITLLGLGVTIYVWPRVLSSSKDLVLPQKNKMALFFLSFLAYFLMPLIMLSGPENANNHYIKTLRQLESRQGREVEIDRGLSYLKNGVCNFRTFAKEELLAKGKIDDCSGITSVRATFFNQNTIHVIDKHRHWGKLRDIFSYIGLLFIVLFWIRFLRSAYPSKQL